jgi:hypothetical protein
VPPKRTDGHGFGHISIPLHSVWGYVFLTGFAAAVLARESYRIQGSVAQLTLTRIASRRSLPAHLKLNYWISARPLLVSRTSSPMTVMFSLHVRRSGWCCQASRPGPISTTRINEAFVHEMPEQLVGLVFAQADLVAYACDLGVGVYLAPGNQIAHEDVIT